MKNFFVLFSTLLLCLSIKSQNFDESFLNSLPQDIREDLLSQVEQKQIAEEPQYRKSSSFVPKNTSLSGDLDRFGSNFFMMMQSSLMPLNEPNFDSNYILDFGDEITIQLVGAKDNTFINVIERDGSIFLPELKKFFLSGLSLEEASILIKEAVKSSFIGVEAFITLTNVRDIQVVITGNVFNPGTYTLSGNSNIFHALMVSGGPSNDGSFRSIKLIRGNDVIEEIDLYDTFINGKANFKKRLRSGDVVFVSPIGNLVTLVGSFKRPGTYEFLNDEMISAAIDFGNGLDSIANLNDVSIYSVLDGNVTKKSIKDFSEINNIKARDGDRFVISSYKLREVNIYGAVMNPGKYIINEGSGIKDLVLLAGGYSKNAYPFGGVLENKKTKEINQLASTKLYESFLDNLANLATKGSEEGFESIVTIMTQLKDKPTSGRVSANFDLDLINAGEVKDIILQNGDAITIPEYLDHVYIFGEVSSEGTIRFSENKDISYYVEKSGGYSNFADKKGIFILQPNGETQRYKRANIFNAREKIKIYPGSVIFIPREIKNSLLVRETAQAYATILGNIGVSLASVSVLKD